MDQQNEYSSGRITLRISELIRDLEKIKQKDGDLFVIISMTDSTELNSSTYGHIFPNRLYSDDFSKWYGDEESKRCVIMVDEEMSDWTLGIVGLPIPHAKHTKS